MLVSTEFHRSIKPLIVINSIFGTGLIEYYEDHRTNMIGLIYAFLVILFYPFVFYLTWKINDTYLESRPFMLQMTFYVHIFSHLFSLLYTMIFGLLRKKGVKNVMKQMETCIRAMGELGLPTNYPKYSRYLRYLLLGAFFHLCIMWSVDLEWSLNGGSDIGNTIIMFFIDHYPLVVMSTTEISYIFWITYIKFKFGELNAVLQGMLTTTIDSPQHKRILQMRNSRKDDSPSFDVYRTYKMNANVKKIKSIKQIHLELVKCARITNTTYGWHILLTMTSSFILTTTLLYNLYYLIFEAYVEARYDLIGFIYWIAYFSFRIIVTSHVCSSTVTEIYECETLTWNYLFVTFIITFLLHFNVILFFYSLHAANTGDIICELYEPSTSKEFRAEIRYFTQQLIQNPLTFTACGFFDLDHTYICSVIGSVTTYLVILIQVGSAPLKFAIENSTFSDP